MIILKLDHGLERREKDGEMKYLIEINAKYSHIKICFIQVPHFEFYFSIHTNEICFTASLSCLSKLVLALGDDLSGFCLARVGILDL